MPILDKPQLNKNQDRLLDSPLVYLVMILIALIVVYCLFSTGWGLTNTNQFLARVVGPEPATIPLTAPYFYSRAAVQPQPQPQPQDLNIIDQDFLQSSGPPFLIEGQVLSSLAGSRAVLSHQDETQEYIVQQGDTLSAVAEKFGISLETVLWANDISRKEVIQPGQKLVILPVSGVLHIVRKGETLSQIAQTYQALVGEIVSFNGLSNPDDIFAGDILILPGAKMPKRAPSVSRVALSQSTFICPIPGPCRITQGLHWFNAIDFSNGQCGEPVYAAAGGNVQRTGYSKIAGYYVRIIHNSGAVTFYGHLSKITTGPGAWVSQGTIIGYTGHSGRTVPSGPAGCHLHFDVRFADNPFAR